MEKVYSFFILLYLCSCTISFQNIDTHGTSTDLIKEQQGASPNISPNIDIPSIP